MLSQASKHSIFLRENYPANPYSYGGRVFNKDAPYGYNDSDYIIKPKLEKRCTAYSAWMTIRGACKKNKQTLCVEWRSFMRFRSWYIKNHIDGFYIDKTLTVLDCATYSPDTCSFLPLWLTSIVKADISNQINGRLSGVFKKNDHKNFSSQCKVGDSVVHLGMFNTEIEAHEAWKKYKLEIVASRKSEIDEINPYVYDNIVKIINR